jgi:hypothetical protein
MSEIRLKDYGFGEQLLKNVELFDEVLIELGESPILENRNFEATLNTSCCDLGIESTAIRPNTLPIFIMFEGEYLRIDIDGIQESFEWTKRHIEKDRDSIKELIRNLFSGYVLIDYRQGSGRFIQFFDSNGDYVDCLSRNITFHMITGRVLFRHKDNRKLYLPMFSKK